jgi:hypothetical protein
MLQVARESGIPVAGVGVFLASNASSPGRLSLPEEVHVLLEVKVEKDRASIVSIN